MTRTGGQLQFKRCNLSFTLLFGARKLKDKYGLAYKQTLKPNGHRIELQPKQSDSKNAIQNRKTLQQNVLTKISFFFLSNKPEVKYNTINEKIQLHIGFTNGL